MVITSQFLDHQVQLLVEVLNNRFPNVVWIVLYETNFNEQKVDFWVEISNKLACRPSLKFSELETGFTLDWREEIIQSLAKHLTS